MKYKDISKIKSKLMSDNKVPDKLISDSGDLYKWLWLPSSDTKHLLEIRNSKHVLKNMRNNSPITLEEHEKFILNYNSLQRLDFVLQHQATGDYVGAMYISLSDHGFEIGKYIGNKNFLGKGIAFSMSNLFINFVKNNVKEIEEIRAVTRINNHKNINLNFKLGFKIVKPLDDYYWLMELKSF